MKVLIFLFFVLISCSSSRIKSENNFGTNFLPVYVSFMDAEIPDTIEAYFKYVLNNRGIKTISKDASKQLSDAEIRRVMTSVQVTQIKSADQLSKGIGNDLQYVYNYLQIKLLISDIDSSNVSVTWKNMPAPPNTKVPIKSSWRTIDMSALSNISWKQALEAIADSIINSKLLY